MDSACRPGAIVVSGFSSAVGLVLRKELGRRHAIFFSLPFAAAFVGALLGGVAIRAGWTQTPGLCLLVPALMLVPGPHLIHSVQEMLENHMQAGMARLALAATILVAAALGMVVGVKLTVGALELTATPSDAMHLTLPLDMVLAGLAACAFGALLQHPAASSLGVGPLRNDRSRHSIRLNGARIESGACHVAWMSFYRTGRRHRGAASSTSLCDNRICQLGIDDAGSLHSRKLRGSPENIIAREGRGRISGRRVYCFMPEGGICRRSHGDRTPRG